MSLNIWTVGGLALAVGFLMGLAVDDMIDAWRASRREQGKRSRIRRPSRWTVIGVLMTIVLLTNTVTGVLLIRQRAQSEAFTHCLVSAGVAQKALDSIVFAVVNDDRAGMRKALEDYVKVRSRPAAELCGVMR